MSKGIRIPGLLQGEGNGPAGRLSPLIAVDKKVHGTKETGRADPPSGRPAAFVGVDIGFVDGDGSVLEGHPEALPQFAVVLIDEPLTVVVGGL